MASLARQDGIRLLTYLDDWLILAPSQDLCQEHTRRVLRLCAQLGFVTNPNKCELTPSQRFTFLGMAFNTRSMMVTPPPERSARIRELVLQLRQAPHASARTLTSLLGMMESLAPLIPLGRVPKRRFQREFRLRWSQTSDKWDQHITLGPWVHWATDEWLDPRTLDPGVPISLPTQMLELYTDASNTGWGAHLGDLHAAGEWDHTTAQLHINIFQQRGRILLRQPLSSSRSPPTLVPQPGNNPPSKAHSGNEERPRGLPQSIEVPTAHRTDAQQPRPSSSVGPLVHSDDRPLRHPLQPSPAGICVPGARSRGPRRRRPLPPVDGPDSVRLSPLPDPPQGHQEGKAGASDSHTHSPVVAGTSMVPGPQVSLPCSSPPADPPHGPTKTTPVRATPLKPADAPPPRVLLCPPQCLHRPLPPNHSEPDQ